MLGIDKTLLELKELREAELCSNEFYEKARIEAIDTLVQKPSLKWTEFLPSPGVILVLVFFALAVGNSLWSIQTLSHAFTIGISIFTTCALYGALAVYFRAQRKAKQGWSLAERLDALRALREAGLVSEAEFQSLRMKLEVPERSYESA